MKHIRIIAALLLTGFLPSLAQAAVYYPQQTSVYTAGITRAEFVRLTMERTGSNFLDGTHCFKDVTTQAFARQVCAAKQRGIITGNPNGYFYPNQQISLVEAAAIVVRANYGFVRSDTIWYRPYIEQLSEWDAFPAGVYNILDPISYSQAIEMIDAAMDGDPYDDDYDDDDDDDYDDRDDDLRLYITVSDTTVEPGDRVTFRIKLENRDNDDLENIDVTAELDSDMEFISASNGGDEDDDEVEWDNIDVDEDETETLLLNVEIDEDADDGDRLTLEVRAEGLRATRTIRVEDDDDDDDDLRITISDDDDPVQEGDTIEYTIRIENRDDNDDVRVDVFAELDDRTEFLSASDDGDEYNGEVEWRNLRIDEDDDIELTVRVRLQSSADDGDTLRFRVRANDEIEYEETEVDDDDGNDDDDDARVNISITDDEDPAEVGDIVTYRIEIENDENDDIEIDIRAFLDDAMTFYSATNDGERDGNDEVIWEDIEIDEDRTRVLLLRVRINNEADDGDTLRLRVEAGDEEDTETTRVDD